MPTLKLKWLKYFSLSPCFQRKSNRQADGKLLILVLGFWLDFIVQNGTKHITDFCTQLERLKVIFLGVLLSFVYLHPPSLLFIALSSIALMLCSTPKLKQVKYWNLFYEWCYLLLLICSGNNETLITPASYLVVKLLHHKPDTLEAMMCFGAYIL